MIDLHVICQNYDPILALGFLSTIIADKLVHSGNVGDAHFQRVHRPKTDKRNNSTRLCGNRDTAVAPRWLRRGCQVHKVNVFQKVRTDLPLVPVYGGSIQQHHLESAGRKDGAARSAGEARRKVVGITQHRNPPRQPFAGGTDAPPETLFNSFAPMIFTTRSFCKGKEKPPHQRQSKNFAIAVHY